MKYLKSIWTASGTAILAALAIFAAMSAVRSKASADKWAEKALEIEEGNVTKGTMTAKKANGKASMHAFNAREKDKKTQKRLEQIKESNEPVSNILDQFSSSS